MHLIVDYMLGFGPSLKIDWISPIELKSMSNNNMGCLCCSKLKDSLGELCQDFVLFCIPALNLMVSLFYLQFLYWKVFFDLKKCGQKSSCPHWNEWQYIQAESLYVAFTFDFLAGFLLLLNCYRLESLRSKIIKERLKRIKKGLLTVTEKTGYLSRYGLRWREFCFIISRPSYLAIYISSLIMICFTHSLQIINYLKLTPEMTYKQITVSVYNLVYVGLGAICMFAWTLVTLLPMTILSISSAIYYCCAAEQEEVEQELATRP